MARTVGKKMELVVRIHQEQLLGQQNPVTCRANVGTATLVADAKNIFIVSGNGNIIAGVSSTAHIGRPDGSKRDTAFAIIREPLRR